MPGLKLVSCLRSKISLYQILVVHLWPKRLTLKLDLRIVRMVEGNLFLYLAVQQTPRRKGAMGDSIPHVLQSTTLLT